MVTGGVPLCRGSVQINFSLTHVVHIQANNGIGGNIVLSHPREHTDIRLRRNTKLLDLRDRSRTGITLPLGGVRLR